MRNGVLAFLLPLAACNPPAADDYVARVGVSERAAPADPIDSPETKGAVWAPSPTNPQRLVYGKPGAKVLFALECKEGESGPTLTYTRYSAADAHAKAVLALIGNGHVSRLNVDAARAGAGWLWQGIESAIDPGFEGLTGGRQVEATIPGAGSLILNPSPLPGELIQRCRKLALPTVPVSGPGEAGAAAQSRPDTTNRAELPPPPAR